MTYTNSIAQKHFFVNTKTKTLSDFDFLLRNRIFCIHIHSFLNLYKKYKSRHERKASPVPLRFHLFSPCRYIAKHPFPQNAKHGQSPLILSYSYNIV